MKHCSKCQKNKPLSDFYKQGKGKASWCSLCTNQNSKRWCKLFPERHATNSRNWALKNKEWVAAYDLRRYHTNPRRKFITILRANLRVRIKAARARKLTTTINLLGCSWPVFEAHIQSRFKSGMTWQNYGHWEIDHIKALCKFDLTTLAGQQAAFHYTNTQPLWKKENQDKGAK